MAVRSPEADSKTLDGRFSNSVFAHSQCFSSKSILLSDISDITYRNSFHLFLRHLLFKFACWLQFAILTAFLETRWLFWNVFQLRGFKVVSFYFWSSCAYQVLCWPFLSSWLLWCFSSLSTDSPAPFYFTGAYFVYSSSHTIFLSLWILQLAWLWVFLFVCFREE